MDDNIMLIIFEYAELRERAMLSAVCRSLRGLISQWDKWSIVEINMCLSIRAQYFINCVKNQRNYQIVMCDNFHNLTNLAMLLKNPHCDPYFEDNRIWREACLRDNIDMANVILTFNTQTNMEKVFVIAIQFDAIKIMKILLDTPNIDIGCSGAVLVLVVVCGVEPALKLLLTDARFNHNYNYYFALSAAVQVSRKNFVKILLDDTQACLHMVDNRILQNAIDLKNNEIIKMLLDHPTSKSCNSYLLKLATQI